MSDRHLSRLSPAKWLRFAAHSIAGLRKAPPRELTVEEHLEAAIGWLLRAQEITGTGGVSKGYHLFHGWLPPYPETTGYIIESVLACDRRLGRPGLLEHSVAMADWVCSVQGDDGSIPDSSLRGGVVFDSGQVIFGLIALFRQGGDRRYLDAAARAAGWILGRQESDGSWVRGSFNGVPHTYYSRVAWALLLVHRETGDESLKSAAVKNIAWAIGCQRENGWFERASFEKDPLAPPFTHTLAYTARGILEAGKILSEDRYVRAVRLTMDRLLTAIDGEGRLPGTIDADFRGDRSYSCLTGNAQLSIIYSILYGLDGNRAYLDAARRLNAWLRDSHGRQRPGAPMRGAIAGSRPLGGDYMRYAYPNWACKFFIDALLAEEQAGRGEPARAG